jgi:hypothetical protein
MYKFVGLLLGVFAVCFASFNPLRGSEPDNRSFVLMNNGSVFHGVVRPVGEKMEIRLGQGATIQVDSKQVGHIAASKLELYQAQVKSIRIWGTGEHWHLTQWCLQQQLLEQAVYHYSELAKNVEPSAKFKQLEQQLKSALLNSEEVRASIVKNEVRSAVAIQESTPNPTGVTLASSVENVSKPSVQHLAIPGYVKKAFHTTVAPILINGCGQAGCHGLPGNSSFHIHKAAGDQASTIANQNLENVLRYVNPKDPSSSELIAYATNAHGIQKSPRFNPLREDDRAHIERIAQWIKSVEFANAVEGDVLSTNSNTVVQAIATDVQPFVATTSASPKSRMDWIREAQSLPEQDRNAKLSKPADNSQSNPPGAGVISAGDIALLESAIDKLERQKKGTGKDPFDPNVFNSKFGTKK